MIFFEEALSLIFKNINQLPAKEVSLDKSVGRVLAEDLYSSINMPRFNKSAMDGYAVKVSDVEKTPVTLRCLGSVKAGASFDKTVRVGECVKIMTGAPMPKGADSVVMVEYTQQIKASVRILRTVVKNENICIKGEDIKINQKVLLRGRKVSVSDISLIAAIGRNRLKVTGKPQVAILNTGEEIIPLGKKLAVNKIYNSNGPQLQALLLADDIEPVFLGIAKDKPKDLEPAIKKGLGYDMLLISGGVSMGDYDLVPAILKKCRVRKIFHKVKIKPGKPLFFGVKKNKLVFGIPGNPVSNFLAYQIFIQPTLRKITGQSSYQPDFREGIISETFKAKGERKHFVPVKIIDQAGECHLSPLNSHGSADIVSLSGADGFMIIDIGKIITKKGSKVAFITWKTI